LRGMRGGLATAADRNASLFRRNGKGAALGTALRKPSLPVVVFEGDAGKPRPAAPGPLAMMDPEILLVDEVLAVGDAAFQNKCFDQVREFRRRGRMLLCVSHSRVMIEELCDRAIWLDHGEVLMTGRVAEVMTAYAGRRVMAAV